MSSTSLRYFSSDRLSSSSAFTRSVMSLMTTTCPRISPLGDFITEVEYRPFTHSPLAFLISSSTPRAGRPVFNRFFTRLVTRLAVRVSRIFISCSTCPRGLPTSCSSSTPAKLTITSLA